MRPRTWDGGDWNPMTERSIEKGTNCKDCRDRFFFLNAVTLSDRGTIRVDLGTGVLRPK